LANGWKSVLVFVAWNILLLMLFIECRKNIMEKVTTEIVLPLHRIQFEEYIVS